MTTPPRTVLSTSYEPKMKAYYAAYQLDQSYRVANFWQGWIDPGIVGIESDAPFPGSQATTTPTAFAPLNLEGTSSIAEVALIFATAWKNYMLALSWPPMPPDGATFGAITGVETSPLGLAAAFSALLAGLTAELALMPGNDPTVAFQEKADAFTDLFRAATLATGIQITGFAPAGSPPPPVVVPLALVK